jgi:hypothetical protein
MENVYIYAFATFGHPSDFQQACILPVKNKLPHKIKLFELTHAIKVFPKSKLHSIRFEKINGEIYISYSIYTYTKELLSDRDGTFIGSSILFSNETPDESLAIENLVQFHNILTSKNVKDDRLLINHLKDFTLPKSIFEDFNKKDFNVTKLDSKLELSNSNSSLVIWSNDNNLGKNYKKVIELFEKYDTIYFTESKEIAEFARSRGIYKTIDETGFDNEINTLIEERKRKREQSISEFKREVQRINEDKNQTIQEFKNQIEQSERTHLENDRKLKESKEDINKIGQFYDDFLNKTNGLINQLSHNNGKLEEVKQIHNSNKILFNNGISDLKRPTYTTTIAKPKPKGNLHTEHQRQDFEHRSGHRRREEKEEEEERAYKIDIFKVATLVLAFLLIVTWVYFLFFKSNSENETQIIQSQEQVDTIPQEQEQKPDDIVTIADLNPKSNSTLNVNDYRIVAKNLKPNMNSDEVVKVIFNKNPTEIGSIYSGQEAIYSKQLIELNKQCFEEKDGLYYFTKDTIKHIPTFKK